MKINFLLLIILSLAFLSCDNYLQEEPFSFLTQDNFPVKAEDGRIAMNGAYKVFYNEYIRGYKYAVYNSSGTDLAAYGGSLTNVYGLYQNFNRTSADNHPTILWKDLYKGINACNFVVDAVEENGFEGGDQLIAEARALRAFYYMELTINFGDAPLKKHQTAGIEELDLPRASVKEIQEFCIQDLDYAENTMSKYPETFAVSNRGGLITLGAVKMIKAHLYMYMAGARRSWDGSMVAGDKAYWSKVRDLCNDILNMGVYELDPDFTNVFSNLYLDIYNKESIWEIDASMPDNGVTFPNSMSAPPYGGTSGGGFRNLRSTKDFWDKYNAFDVRRDWTLGTGRFVGYDFVTDTTSGVSSMPYVNKFRKVAGSSGNYGWRSPYNLPIYRLSEVYLMLAEALNEVNNGPTTEAYTAINTVRYRARADDHKTDGTVLPDLSGLDYNSFMTAIIDERAYELAFEGQRRMDIIRWGIYMERVQLIIDADIATNVREYHMLLPIPLQEKDQQPDWQQNDGW